MRAQPQETRARLARPAKHVGRKRAFDCPVILTRMNGEHASAQAVGHLSVDAPRRKKVGKGWTHDTRITFGGLVERGTLSERARLALLAGEAVSVWLRGHEWAASGFGDPNVH